MSSIYLFRIDGAKDNDSFFDCARSTACEVYAGLDFRAGACEWIPDFIRVTVGEPPGNSLLTLIELEATESAAVISCRKYLPEDSDSIVRGFLEYLDRVIHQCRSRADPRENEFTKLTRLLQDSGQIIVTTAGALRSSTHFVEELPLIGQPTFLSQRPYVKLEEELQERVFRGLLRLSQKEAKGLVRCVKILDAIIRHCDHSGGTIRSWIGHRTQPLKRLVTGKGVSYPALSALLLKRGKGGTTFDFEKALTDVVEIWSAAQRRQVDSERTRSLISRYFTIALQIGPRDQMAAVFETARGL